MSVHKQSWLERLLYPYFQRFIVAHEQSQRWTKHHCPSCNAPIVFDGAAYCAMCGVSLLLQIEAPKPPVVAVPVPIVAPIADFSPATDGLYRLNMRPMDTFNEARRNGAGVKTAMTEAINIEKLRKKSKGFKS